jgi:hypothetical protein
VTRTPWGRGVVALAAALLAGIGCGVLAQVDATLASTGAFDLPIVGVDDGCAVTVTAGIHRGRGLVAGAHTILTVAHVIERADEIEVGTSALASTAARITERFPADPEDVVLLELETEGRFGFEGFPATRILAMGEGPPAWVLTRRGPRPFASALEPGDSGSPVLDASGLPVALVEGRGADGATVVISLRRPHALPPPALRREMFTRARLDLDAPPWLASALVGERITLRGPG